MYLTSSSRAHLWRPILASLMVAAFLLALWVPPQSTSAAIQVPDVTAQGIYAYDLTTGIELFAKNEHERMPIGSVVKIVTALVTVKHANLEDEVVILEEDLVDDPSYSNMQLQAGDTLTVSQLLYGLLIPSGSDGADALARHVGKIITGSDDPIAQADGFMREMNAFIAEQGLENTRFTNPHGLDAPNNYSTAYDIAILSGLLMENEHLARIVREPGYSFVSEGPEARQYQAQSTNQLLGQSGVVGIKTGSTGEAGGCVILARQVNNGNSTVITAVLGSDLVYDANSAIVPGSDARWDDATRLFEFMDSTFTWVPVSDGSTFADLATELSVWDVQVAGDPTIPVTNGDSAQTRYQLALNPDGGGTLEIFFDQDRVGSIPLEPSTAGQAVDTATIGKHAVT